MLRRGRAAPARRSRLGDDRGSVAAELAVALPAALITIAFGVGALSAAATQVSLQDAAADSARLLGRGESPARAAGVVRDAVDGASSAARTAGDLVCVTASLDMRIGRLISVPLQASSCALAGGL